MAACPDAGLHLTSKPFIKSDSQDDGRLLFLLGLGLIALWIAVGSSIIPSRSDATTRHSGRRRPSYLPCLAQKPIHLPGSDNDAPAPRLFRLPRWRWRCAERRPTASSSSSSAPSRWWPALTFLTSLVLLPIQLQWSYELADLLRQTTVSRYAAVQLAQPACSAALYGTAVVGLALMLAVDAVAGCLVGFLLFGMLELMREALCLVLGSSSRWPLAVMDVEEEEEDDGEEDVEAGFQPYVDVVGEKEALR